MPQSFKEYVLSGRFNKVANEAVAEAIAKAKPTGLPREGSAIAPASNAQSAQASPVHGSSIGTSRDATATASKPKARRR